MCYDGITHHNLGYAYVNFQNTADSERAFKELNYTHIKNKPIHIHIIKNNTFKTT